jgi:NitT/TauT family transport system substrate-binding protein
MLRPLRSTIRIAAIVAAALMTSTLAAPLGAAPALTVVHVGGVFSDDMTPVFYAVKAGLFRDAGLDVQLVPATSGNAMTQAVIGGTYEFGKSSILGLINAHLRNLPLSVIAAGGFYDSRNPFAALCVATDSTITVGGKDLNGKTIGTPALNDLNQLVVSAWVGEHGGDPSTLHFVELPNAVAGPALTAHRVDAAVMLQPILADALAAKQVRSIGNAYDAVGKQFVFAAYFTSPDYAKAHPDIVAKFVRVLYEAAMYTNRHHGDTATLVADITNSPLDVISRMPRTDGATKLDPAYFQPVIDAAAKYHLINAPSFPAREMLLNAPGLK